MSDSMKIYTLERTVISQANELANLRESSLKWIAEYNSAERKYQAELERRQQYGGLIIAIGQILNDDEIAFEEQVETIASLIHKWDEWEDLS